MSFIWRIRERVNRLMIDRNGSDALNRGLMILYIPFLIIAFAVGSPWWYIPPIILCLTIFFRMFSRNVVRRQRENLAYYKMMKHLGASWRRFMVRLRDRKKANFFRCPACKADIRMPKRVGTFQIRCPKCGESFSKTFH